MTSETQYVSNAVLPSPSQGTVERCPVVSEELVEQAWSYLLNVDDRTSPEEYPDMALIKFDELREIIATFVKLDRCAPHPVPLSFEQKTAINKRFQELYETGMQSGKHGHYETMFVAMHGAYAALLIQLSEQNAEAESGLERLGSSEAFTLPRSVRSPQDDELLARMDFARELVTKLRSAS